ncbi:molybdate ABC transporter permease subunit [Arenicella sp. 4NH20-0111]|uniref:molybdate ABC transporter permease subunit n=1 Tax=Arenicella sp. 4NH20-0111 TaxID=3127648 RepID=UPI0031066799
MISPSDLVALGTTLKLASLSTAILVLVCLPFSWWLATTRWRFKYLVESIIALPLVLPPTVLGFYLLVLFSPNGYLGAFIKSLTGEGLAFSFTGLVVGSVIYSLPFVVQPLQNSFAAIGRRPLEVAASLGASPFDAFRSVVLPMAKPGILTATVLGFAHTVGEFGIVLMIGGNIPGETRVASIAIYEHVETLEYGNAHALSLLLLGLSMALLILVYANNRRVGVFHS